MIDNVYNYIYLINIMNAAGGYERYGNFIINKN